MSPDESNECHMSINECQFGPYDLPSVPDDESWLVPNACQIVWMTTDAFSSDKPRSVPNRSLLISAHESEIN